MATIVSVSGGKDSTALLALAVVQDAPGLVAVFADTGHEHPTTIEYVAYLSDWLERQGHEPVKTVRADFSERMAARRAYLEQIAAGEVDDRRGVRRHTRESAARTAAAMVPTGNPFLDLCMLKGRFPGAKSRFCTGELKTAPIYEQAILPAIDACGYVESWQGVRADESPHRARLAPVEGLGGGLFIVRPILRWSVDDVFEAHRAVGLDPNPLYSQGMGRVGCMPCIMCRKDELLEIGRRFPGEVERVDEWERVVSACSKRGGATFFPTADGRGVGIREVVEWSKTSRGTKQYDLLRSDVGEGGCSSAYGLCE